MSLWWIAITIVCAALLFIAVTTAVVLFSPLVFIVDSQSREFRVRWLAFIEFWTPLPGGAGAPTLRIAGLPVTFGLRKRLPKQAPQKPAAVKAPAPPPVHFLWRCLRNARIRRGITNQLVKLLRRVAGAFKLTELQSRWSSPDPAINGILAGALAQTRLGRSGRLSVNFTGENSLRCEVRLYPFRIANAGLLFISGLPYVALIREWRSSRSPQRSQRTLSGRAATKQS